MSIDVQTPFLGTPLVPLRLSFQRRCGPGIIINIRMMTTKNSTNNTNDTNDISNLSSNDHSNMNNWSSNRSSNDNNDAMIVMIVTIGDVVLALPAGGRAAPRGDLYYRIG